MGSRRFPGKMLRPLGSMPVMSWVIQRVKRAQTLDDVVVATTTAHVDDPIAQLSTDLGVHVFRGSENDVLGRFTAAAAIYEASAVVRVCADNPFVDPGEIDRLVSGFMEQDADYSCNHQDRLGSKYADGFGAEVMRRGILDHLSRVSQSPAHREHVTAAIHDGTITCRMFGTTAPAALRHPELRFDVDTPEDLERLARLVASGIHDRSSAAEIIEADRITRRVSWLGQ